MALQLAYGLAKKPTMVVSLCCQLNKFHVPQAILYQCSFNKPYGKENTIAFTRILASNSLTASSRAFVKSSSYGFECY